MGDYNQQYQDFLAWLKQQQPMDDASLANLQGVIPAIELYNQYLSATNESKGYDLQLQKLENDFDLSAMQVEQARKELEFQSGPYYDYLVLKSNNDTTQSNNDVARSNNDLGISNNQLAMSGDDVLKSKNSALQSAYQTQSAGYGADEARYNYLMAIGALPGSSASSVRHIPASLGY